MRQDPITLSKIWQTVSYGFMAIGLFLLFFLGAQAFARITDASQVVGKPRQKPTPADYALQTVLPLVSSNNVSAASAAIDGTPQTGAATKDAEKSTKGDKASAASRPDLASDNSGRTTINKNSGR